MGTMTLVDVQGKLTESHTEEWHNLLYGLERQHSHCVETAGGKVEVKVQVRMDAGLAQDGGQWRGEEGMASGCMLRTEPMGPGEPPQWGRTRKAGKGNQVKIRQPPTPTMRPSAQDGYTMHASQVHLFT